MKLGFELVNPYISLLVWMPPLLQKREKNVGEKYGKPEFSWRRAVREDLFKEPIS